MATTYPSGYGSEYLSLAKLRDKYGPKMHPEYAARLFACIEAAGGLVGIGNGWRSTSQQAANYKKHPGRFAPPGKSFHESHTWRSGIEGFAAVDTVGRHSNEGHQDAWAWMRDHAGKFGLHTFHDVNGEPWHTQFNDLPNGVSSWKNAGNPDPNELATTKAGWKPAEPDFGDHPLNDGKPVLRLDSLGELVRYTQLVISHKAGGRITVDGQFGPQTEGRVKDAQAFFQLRPTGVVDWEGTWQVIDLLAGRTKDAKQPGKPAPKAPRPKSDEGDVTDGYYWIRRGDTPLGVATLVYGDGKQHTKLDPCDPPEPGFNGVDHQIRLPGLAGRTTRVQAGEGAWQVVARLYPDANPATLLERFYALNGGRDRVLQPTDFVFLDAPE